MLTRQVGQYGRLGMERNWLTVDTIVEPRLLVVVNLTSPDVFEAVELPEPVGTAELVVMKVDPLLSVVVMTTPPDTRLPTVEVMLLPAESFPVATKTVLVPDGVVAVTDLVVAPEGLPALEALEALEAEEAVAIETTEEIVDAAAITPTGM